MKKNCSIIFKRKNEQGQDIEEDFSDLIEYSDITTKLSNAGQISGYQIELYHKKLNVHKYLSAREMVDLEGRIYNQINEWDIKWNKSVQEQEDESKEEKAALHTKEAQEKIKVVKMILENSCLINDLKQEKEFSWTLDESNISDYLKINANTGCPEEAVFLNKLAMPDRNQFFKKIKFYQWLLGLKKRIRVKQEVEFNEAIAFAKSENERIETENLKRSNQLESLKEKWINVREQYLEGNESVVAEYCTQILNKSKYPMEFPKEYDLQYNAANKILVIDYKLPSMKDIPYTKSIKYVKTSDEIVESYLSEREHSALYDTVIYQITIRVLYELFNADIGNVLEAISLNGFVTATNLGTGNLETSCIISVQTTKEALQRINFKGIIENQSFKECFKALKGIGSSKLSTMTPVKPLLELDKKDKRFKDDYDVAHMLNDEVNVAAMDWEDFEHLVREIFEKEFMVNGGEVKITQASADGGVDAVAFDPDPLRGGKIIIQAKRYTNTVGVAAVRDLYGTVINEGATKGVLVTTADYGPDSYAFAKDKPITLLNGSNLLHLLEKHGHKAKIDLKEAKKITQR